VWVAADDGSADGLLARRKRWRTHRLPDEPGDKCTVMPDFQELSGHVRAGRGRQAQRRFWDAIRTRVGSLELKEEETLCALAFIKRFFPKISRKAISGELDVDHWPSTLYIGAVPWLREVRDRAGAEAKEYVEALREVAVEGTIRRRVPLAEFDGAEPGEVFRLDANYYHRGFLASERRAPLMGADESARSRLVDLLRKVNQSAGSSPPVYYAFLLADGDKLGEHLKAGGAQKVSEALSTFGKRADELVQKHHGVTVYAGGDDVLAMLPVANALPCADELAKAYKAAFTCQDLPAATLSAAVVFAHVRMPVGQALADARDLLENVAKEGNNRDSLAAAVLKPGGTHCQWVTTWIRRYPDGREERAIERLTGLAEMMRDKDGGRGFSASLLHHTHQTLTLLCGQPDWSPGLVGELPAGLDLGAYIRAEVLDSWESRQPAADTGSPTHGDRADGNLDLAGVEQVTELVVDLLPPSVNPNGAGDLSTTVDTSCAGLDGLLLARFVAGGGREEDHG
jgi:CRISPR-associated protein Cmr2